VIRAETQKKIRGLLRQQFELAINF